MSSVRRRTAWLAYCLCFALATASLASTSDPDPGSVTVVLSGYTAEISGPEIRKQRGQITHWHSTECTAEWSLTVNQSCEATVAVDTAVIEDFAGSRFEVLIGDQRIVGTMKPTGGWEDYRRSSLGELHLPAGTHRVRLRPIDLPNGVMGNVRTVRVQGVHLSRGAALNQADPGGPIRVIVTSRHGGDRLAPQGSLRLENSSPADAVAVAVDATRSFQQIEGFGGAFTESAATVWRALSPQRQQELIKAYFDPDAGHGYTLCRTHINSCDFSSGNYAYSEVDGDFDLEHFSIDHDRENLIPLIHAAQRTAGEGRIKLLASPWSPPAWMKTNGKMTEGGKLKPECRDVWARYYCRYIEEYKKAGINIWGLTVQNEPAATQRWESCRYTAEEERDFVRDHLGPALLSGGHSGVKLLVWDHNRDLLYERASCVFDDPEASRYVWGAGFHWYVSDEYHHVEMVSKLYPDKKLLFTEGCLEGAHNIGQWSTGETYARAIINDLNHGAVGWIDWNLLLNTEGGPNHVGNYCAAPVIADTDEDRLIYGNSYHYIGHFSRFIKPGAYRVFCKNTGTDVLSTAFRNPDGSVVVILLNERDYPVQCALRLAGKRARLLLEERSIATLVADAALLP
ncbi:MAG: glycoside hydrolase family 30 beta sandwich domain-containing protein [Planctomycetota bacterium]